MKKTLFTLAALFTSALATFAQPATVPGVKEGATDVYQLFVNGGQNGFNFSDWGGVTLSKETIDGKEVEKETNFKYSGCDFTSYNAYEKEYFHLDVYPLQDMTLGVVMINYKTPYTTTDNEAEKGYQINDLKANEWNSIDIPVKYYVDKGASMERVHQVKLIGKVTKDATDLDASDEFQNADGTQSFYIGNYYFYGKRDTSGETGKEFKSFTIDLPIVGANGTYTINADPRSTNGRIFNGEVTYSINGDGAKLTQDGNKLTVVTTKAGTYTITAKNGENSATATITAIEPTAAPTAKAEDVLAYYSDTYNAKPATDGISQQAWNWGFVNAEEIDLAANDKAYSVAHAGSFGFNLGAKDITEYSKVHADIYASKATTGHIVWEGGTGIDENNTAFSLKEGWNSVDIDIKDNKGTAATWLQFYIGGNTDADKIDFVIDNVYATIGDANAPLAVTVSNGVAKVTGKITANDVQNINDADAMAIDLSNVRAIDEDVTTITPKHANAIILIGGTVTNNVATADEKFKGLVGKTKNLIVKSTYNYPVEKLQFTDKDGEPQWNGEGCEQKFFSTASIGYIVTRSLPAKKYATICTTATINLNDVPQGINVWKPISYSNNTITFEKESGNLAAFKAYIVYNDNDEATDLSFSGQGDFNLVQYQGQTYSEAIGETNVKFTGNFANETKTDGTQWVLQNNEDGTASIVKANGPRISAFRAYFTGLDATQAEAKLSFIGDGEVNGINAIKNAEANAENAPLYNLAGQKVSKAYKGIVIQNGKKFINK